MFSDPFRCLSGLSTIPLLFAKVWLLRGLLTSGLVAIGLAAPLSAQVTPPQFSTAGGHFDAPISVSITGEPGTVVRYSLDASSPSEVSGTIFASDLQITTTSVVRAVAIENNIASDVVTHTYIFPTEVLSQPDSVPAGYPATWAGYTADYGMDPDVTTVDGPRVDQALRALPSVSLVTDIEHLFEATTGIYTNSLESGIDWERPTSVEFLFPNGDRHAQNAGLRMQGGGSRRPERSPKHNFRLLFKTDYGPSKLTYPLFNDTAAGAPVTESFDTLVLRAGYNNSWLHSNFLSTYWANEDQRLQAQYIRDETARRLQRDMGYPSPHGRFVHLYLNGMYWGLYNIVERPSAPFAADYLGGEKEEWDALNSGELIDGTAAAWNATRGAADAGLANASNYAALQDWIDVDTLSDYLVLNHWIGNHDWWWQNWYAVRKREPNAKWHFVNWDSEHSLEHSLDAVTESRVLAESYWPAPTGIFERLKANPEFLMTFADSIYRNLFNQGALQADKAAAVYSEMAGRIDLAIVAESARWGDYRRDVHPGEKSQLLYTRDDHWVAERDRVLAQYFPNRTSELMVMYRSAGLYPSLDGPVVSPWGGVLSSNQNVTLSHANGSGTIYYTTDGSDPRLAGGTLAPGAVQYQGSFPVTASGAVVNARVLDAGEWSAKAAATFQPVAATQVVINEINYNSDINNEAGDWVELHNPGTNLVDLAGWSFRDSGSSFVIPFGVLLPAGGYRVLVQSSSQFAAVHPGVVHVGDLGFGFSGSSERLELRNPQAQLIDEVTYDDGLPWPTAPDGNGPTLELIDAASDNTLAASWAASVDPFGTPGAENSVSGADPCEGSPAPLVIQEIHYNSPLFFEVQDWIEITNPTANTVDLGGWRFQDEDNLYEVPAGVLLAADGLVVLVENQAAFEEGYGTIPEYGGEFGFGLSGGGERITLSSPTGCLVDVVEYDDVAPWPVEADGQGATLELIDRSFDNSLGSSWSASTVFAGTPGQSNSVNRTLHSDGFETGDLQRWSAFLP